MFFICSILHFVWVCDKSCACSKLSLLLFFGNFSGTFLSNYISSAITTGEFGGKNPFLGVAYVVVGSISLMFALLFVVKQTVAPRAKADASLLNWT